MIILEIIVSLALVTYFTALLANAFIFATEYLIGSESKNFDDMLKHMLAPNQDYFFYEKFVGNVLYKQLGKNKKSKYINSNTFTFDSFWSIFSQTLFNGKVYNLDEVKKEIYLLFNKNDINIHMKTLLLQLLYEAQLEGVSIKSKVKIWYENHLVLFKIIKESQRRRLLLYICIVIPILLNLDYFSIYNQLCSDPALALQIANQAQLFTSEQSISDSFDDSVSIYSSDDMRAIRRLVQEDIASLESPLGVGWKIVTPQAMRFIDWLTKITGWLAFSIGMFLCSIVTDRSEMC